MTSRPLVLAATIACLAACSAFVDAPDGSEAPGKTSEAVTSCSFNKLPLPPLGSCTTVCPTGSVPTACSGTVATPSALSGCSAGTDIRVQGMGPVPLWVCPASVTLPPYVGVASDSHGTPYAKCNYDLVTGQPTIPGPSDPPCAAVMSFTQIANSCIGSPPSNAVLVMEAVLWSSSIGTDCSGGCSTIGGTKKYGTGP